MTIAVDASPNERRMGLLWGIFIFVTFGTDVAGLAAAPKRRSRVYPGIRYQAEGDAGGGMSVWGIFRPCQRRLLREKKTFRCTKMFVGLPAPSAESSGGSRERKPSRSLNDFA
jgi:hypothetical protein